MSNRHICEVLSIEPMGQVGPPTTGYYRKGDLIADSAGSIWKCQTAGIPGTWSQMSSSVDEVVTPTTYRGVEGFELFWNSVSQVKLGRVGERSIATDYNNTTLISYTGQLTADITVSGANGRDAGAEAANTWYAVHVIQGTAGVAALLSTSATAPTLPSGYTVFRRIGWVRNNASSNFLKFFCDGRKVSREYSYDETRASVVVIAGGNATTFTTINFSALVPPGVTIVEAAIGFNLKADGDLLGFRAVGSTLTLTTCLDLIGGGPKTPAAAARDSQKITLRMSINAGNGNREIQYAVTINTDIADIYVSGFKEEI